MASVTCFSFVRNMAVTSRCGMNNQTASKVHDKMFHLSRRELRRLTFVAD